MDFSSQSTVNARRLSVFLSLTLLVGVFVLPPLCPVHTRPLTSFWTEWLAGILLLVSWAALFLGNGRKLALPSAFWLWLVWGVSLTLSVITNHYDLRAPIIFSGVFWIAGLMSLFLGAELVQRLGRERLLVVIAYIMTLSGILQAVLGLLRFYGLLTHISVYLGPLKSDRLEGLLNYPTLTGFSLWLSICALAYLFFKRRIGWIALVLGSMTMAIPVVATGDRSSILYWLCLVMVTLTVLVRRRNSFGNVQNLDRRRILGGLAVISLVVLVSVPLFRKLDDVVGPYMQSLGYVERSQNVDTLYQRRGDFWGIRGSAFRKAIVLAKHSPFFGIGPGHFAYQNFLLNDKPYSIREGTIDTHTHNIFSMLLAEEGVVGLAVLIAACALLLWWWWRLEAGLETLFMGAVLALFFAYSNIEFPLWYLNFLIIFMIFCGILSPVSEKDIRFSFTKPMAAAAVLVLGLIFSWYAARGYRAISDINWDQIASAQNARKLEKWFSSPLWAANAGEAFEQVTIAVPRDIPDQLSLAQQVIEFLPTPAALLHKVFLLNFQGRKKAACRLAIKTGSSYPDVVKHFNYIVQWYFSNPDSASPSGIEQLGACFQKGADAWQAQWQ